MYNNPSILAALALVLVAALAVPCIASHEYPRVCNYFTGYTDLQYVEMLSRWDVAVLNCNVQDARPEMPDSLRALNPDMTLLTYFPVACIWAGYDSIGRIGSGYGDKAEAEDWWLYDTRGNRVGASDYAWVVNMTTMCPEDGSGRRVYEWLPGYIRDEIVSSGTWDGLLLDGLFERAHWLNNIEHFFQELPAEVDANRDGIADDPDSLNAWWGEGMEQFLILLRQEIGDIPILVGNGKNSGNAAYLNGGIREDFPNMHGGWEENMFADYGYLSMCRDYRQEPMNLTLMLCWWRDEGAGMYGPTRTTSYEKFVRYTLSSSLLGDGYYILNGTESQLWWEDLYDVNLGSATTVAYRDSVWNAMFDRYDAFWRRDFTNGSVYCNPYDRNLTLEDGTWLTPQDGRIKSFSPPAGTTVGIVESASQREFTRTDRYITYSAELTNNADEATYSYVWAHLIDGPDTLATSALTEHLVGVGRTCTVDRILRLRNDVPKGTYSLEVVVGTEGRAVVSRDTMLVERVNNIRRVQKTDGDVMVGQGNLLVLPQPLVGPEATMVLKVKGTESSRGMLTVRLYDVRGRLVRTVTGDEPGEDSGLEIEMRAEGGGTLVPGVYFVAVETGTQVLRKKVVLLHR